MIQNNTIFIFQGHTEDPSKKPGGVSMIGLARETSIVKNPYVYCDILEKNEGEGDGIANEWRKSLD